MSEYRFRRPPAGASQEAPQMALFVEEQLRQVGQALQENNGVQNNVLHSEPVKPQEGLTVNADGTDWDPGAGAGMYVYRDGGWIRLDGVDKMPTLDPSNENEILIVGPDGNALASGSVVGVARTWAGTGARPGSPVNGLFGVNTVDNKLEFYSNGWVQVP